MYLIGLSANRPGRVDIEFDIIQRDGKSSSVVFSGDIGQRNADEIIFIDCYSFVFEILLFAAIGFAGYLYFDTGISLLISMRKVSGIL